MQEIDHIFSRLNDYRENIPNTNECLNLIRQALFGYFDIKYVKKGDAKKIETKPMPSMPKHTFTTDEKNAWIKAGYPNLKTWLPEYRKQKHGKSG